MGLLGRRLDLGGLEFMLLEGEVDRERIVRPRPEGQGNECCQEEGRRNLFYAHSFSKCYFANYPAHRRRASIGYF